ncbi:MAG: sigma-54 interaction domain-containing protein [Myxococcota bacterium]
MRIAPVAEPVTIVSLSLPNRHRWRFNFDVASLGRDTLRARARLAAIDEPAILLSPDYRILDANAAYRSRFSRPLILGQDCCHAISHGYEEPCDQHGEACPLRRARQSKRTERVFHVHEGPTGPEHVDITLEPIFDEHGELTAFVERIRPIEVAQAVPARGFVGRSPRFVQMLELLHRGATSDVPILLLGESGAGKELAAQAVHGASPRRQGPFVPVECSGINESLFESELFGHVRGAFTGATENKGGLVEAAAGGTLFLDEIGDVPLSMQVKLLRLLESGTYRRVGDTTPRHASFRLICATHRDLASMVKQGTFRQDLLFRINTYPIQLPSLRERPEDIALLSEALLAGSGKHLCPDALRRLEAHPFPGNVRELRNILERALLLTDDDEIRPEHLPVELQAPNIAAEEPTPSAPWPDALLPLEEAVRHYLRWAARTHQGDRASLAKRLGMSERTLYRRLKAATADVD